MASTSRAALHALVDGLPDDALASAAAILEDLLASQESAPMSAEEEAGIRRGLADAAAGRERPAEEAFALLRAKYGLGGAKHGRDAAE
ncbi:MAG: hypothetical protein R3A52_25605 [Polyangiales bacterium]